MVKNPPEGMPRITPYVWYNDVKAALTYLETTFGFAKRGEIIEVGPAMHAEMTYQDGVIMMGSANTEGCDNSKSPQDINAVTMGLFVYVDDVDAHCAHAKAAGAEIKMPPTDMFWGDRMYSVKDLEGHSWSFATHTKDIAPEDMILPDVCGE